MLPSYESVRRWAGSCCASIGIHGVLMALLLGQSITFGAKAPGSGGIEVSLGPMSAGGGATMQKVAASAPAAPSVAPAPVLQAQVDEPAEPPDPEAMVKVLAKKKLVPVPVPKKPRVAKTPPPVKQEVVRNTRGESKATDAGTATSNSAKADTKGSAEDTGASGDGKSSAAGRGAGTNTTAGGTGGGVPGMSPSYFSQLQAWLEKHKEFPRTAQMRRQQGVAKLYFVIDREGKVLDYRIEKSSGHELLDREVLAMIRRASPVPPMPDDMKETRLEVVVPVQFFLR